MNSQAIQHDFKSGILSRVLHGVNNRTEIDAQLDVEVNDIAFSILVDGDSAVISFGSFSDALVLYRMFAQYMNQANNRELYQSLLRKLNMTVYLQNRHLGIVGPNASAVMSRLFDLATHLLGKNRKVQR